MPIRKKIAKKGKSQPSANFKRLVKKVVQTQAEHKYAEANVVSLAFDAAPALATVVKSLEVDVSGNIVQGTGANQRLGDRIHMVSADFSAVFVPTTATTGAVRILIGQCLDQQTHSAMTLRQGDILSQSAGANYSPITSFYDHEPLVSYKLLMDEVITWDAQNTAAPRLIRKHFTNLPLRNRNYEGNTAVSTGAFFYCLLSANGVAADLKYPSFKMTYTDL